MRFGVLYVDPPWSYKVYSKKGAVRKITIPPWMPRIFTILM